jgi:hypothetical protein
MRGTHTGSFMLFDFCRRSTSSTLFKRNLRMGSGRLRWTSNSWRSD